MDKKNVGFTAEEYFNSGFNCAESVSLAITEVFQKNIKTDIPKVASFFGGGVGSTHREMCGAISGAVLAIGLLLGRTNPKIDIDEHKEIVKKILDVFNKNYSTTKCEKLIEGLDKKAQLEKCTEIVGFITELVYENITIKSTL